MVVLSFSISKFNQWFGPVLLRYSVRARFILSAGIIRDNPYLDALCGIPIALKLLQLDIYQECKILESNNVQTKAATVLSKSSVNVIQRQRIEIFEKYLRPALLPNNTWTDVRVWQFHYRMIKWLRTEYLIVKYRPLIRDMFHESNNNSNKFIRTSPQLNKDFFGGLQNIHQPNRNAMTEMMRSFGSYVTGATNNNNQQLVTKDDEVFDPMKLLPHSTTLTKAFDMMDWEENHKNLKATRTNMVNIAKRIGGDVLQIRGGSIGIAHVGNNDPSTTDVSHLSLEEIIEVAGGHVQQCNGFNALCEDANIYQFWTREYIQLLGRYLLKRSVLLQQKSDPMHPMKETVILDVGAGDGLLALLLREFMTAEYNNSNAVSVPSSKKRPFQTKTASQPNEPMNTTKQLVPTIIASDSGAWGISPIAPVLKQTVEEAINEYTTTTTNQYHVIVLCSWMPMNTDWTSIFRQNNGGVDEYILIGECDDGQCGDNWLTWGNAKHLHDETDVESDTADTPTTNGTNGDPSITPLYQLDGYERCDLNELVPYQFSRFDCRTSKTGRTVSFRRNSRKKNQQQLKQQ